MTELMGLRAYSRARGMSLSTLQHHVKTGKVRLIDGKIDPDYADAVLPKRIDPDQSTRSLGGQARTWPAKGGADGVGSGVAPDSGNEFMEAKTRSERARAALAEIELREKAGELVRADRVRAETFERARIARDALLGVPDRLAPVLAGETDAARIHALLAAELRRICDELSKAWAPASQTTSRR